MARDDPRKVAEEAERVRKVVEEARQADQQRVAADEVRVAHDDERVAHDDQRTEADTARTDADAAAILILSESIGEMVDVVIHIGGEMRAMDERRTVEVADFAAGMRRLRMLTRLGAAGIALLLLLAWWNHGSLAVIHSTVDHGGTIYKRNAAAQVQVVIALVAEGDCLQRRALAGLPAPPNMAQPCRAQTPPNVYPGGTP